MRAGVVESTDDTVHAPNHDHRPAADHGRDIVAVSGYLALVTEVNPAPVKNTVHFDVEQSRVEIGRPVNSKHALLGAVIDQV